MMRPRRRRPRVASSQQQSILIQRLELAPAPALGQIRKELLSRLNRSPSLPPLPVALLLLRS
jgi:hypothetical protein